MGAGSLALWLLMNTVTSIDAPVAMADRSIAIPYSLAVNPAEVSEIVLYVSIDQGRAWSRAAVIKPTDRHFAYEAPSDGMYWFTVAVVYKTGTQVPADVRELPPQKKLLIDTVKPVVRMVSAERVGDEVVVTWDMQEANPDLTTLKLEYRPADAAPGFGIAVPVNPGLAGMARFRPNVPGPIAVRLTINDTARNVGFAERMVAAGPQGVPGVDPIQRTTAYNPGAAPVDPPIQNLTPPPAEQLPSGSGPVPLATSGRTRETPTAPVVNNAAAPRSDLVKPFHTNEQSVTIDYEIERQGPSGVAKVEVYLTQDDGRTWMKWQDLSRNVEPAGNLPGNQPPSTTLPVTLRLPEREGLYGFRIVPYSGSQLSAGSPQPGDAPEVRVQLDKTAPFVELYKPDADPRDANVLMLQWRASDPYLAEQPIHIYWSENPNGDWKSIASAAPGADTGLANAGRFAWALPPNMPLKVYLKITAEDKAGNVGEAVTPQPIVVDLHKPAGRVKGIAAKPRG
ncbi:MAG: hypothetical protein K1X57_13725 [Gemmataceae bacterium]|nr:hypothetical protein [Gemmataceae bacterium]